MKRRPGRGGLGRATRRRELGGKGRRATGLAAPASIDPGGGTLQIGRADAQPAGGDVEQEDRDQNQSQQREDIREVGYTRASDDRTRLRLPRHGNRITVDQRSRP